MRGFNINIGDEAKNNENFRKVLYTGKYCQLVLMTLKPSEDIGMEVHDNVDQFFRFEEGNGKAILDGVEHIVGAEDVVLVPAGTNHNIINTSDSAPLRLYTIYSPPNHADGTIRATKEAAEKNEEHFDGKTTE
jgi:mannose-6-phosphate isomerase-like protein (cupin superfamily)